MVALTPSCYLVYEENLVKVVEDFNEIRELIDFNEVSRKVLPSIQEKELQF